MVPARSSFCGRDRRKGRPRSGRAFSPRGFLLGKKQLLSLQFAAPEQTCLISSHGAVRPEFRTVRYRISRRRFQEYEEAANAGVRGCPCLLVVVRVFRPRRARYGQGQEGNEEGRKGREEGSQKENEEGKERRDEERRNEERRPAQVVCSSRGNAPAPAGAFSLLPNGRSTGLQRWISRFNPVITVVKCAYLWRLDPAPRLTSYLAQEVSWTK